MDDSSIPEPGIPLIAIKYLSVGGVSWNFAALCSQLMLIPDEDGGGCLHQTFFTR